MKKKTIKVWWLRKGDEGFLVSNLWMNGANCRLTAKGKNFELHGSHTHKTPFKVIPCTIIY